MRAKSHAAPPFDDPLAEGPDRDFMAGKEKPRASGAVGPRRKHFLTV